MKWNTVYIIEDEPKLLQLYMSIIKELGIHAKGYTRASQFFDKFNQDKENSILILDLCVPEMDGIEVMIQLRKMVNPPSVILVSGFDTELLHSAEHFGEKLKLNILPSLTKPIRTEELLELFEE